jgi:excisionase family DNA binding protein
VSTSLLPALMKIAEVARLLGVTPRTIGDWLRDPPVGFPRPKHINKRYYFLRADVAAWLAREPANAS